MKNLILTLFGTIFLAFTEEQIFGNLYSAIPIVNSLPFLY